eukprot:IDg7823t1
MDKCSVAEQAAAAALSFPVGTDSRTVTVPNVITITDAVVVSSSPNAVIAATAAKKTVLSQAPTFSVQYYVRARFAPCSDCYRSA